MILLAKDRKIPAMRREKQMTGLRTIFGRDPQ